MNVFYPYPEEFTFNRAREIQTIHTCHALARQGHEVTLGVAGRSWERGDALLDYFQLKSLPQFQFVFLPRYVHFTRHVVISFQSLFLHKLLEYLQRARASGSVDIIYTRHLKVAEFCLRQKLGIPIVFEAHEIFSLGQVDSPSKFQRLLNLENFVYSNVQGIVTISNHLKSYLESHFPVQCPIQRAPDGVDLDLFGKINSNRIEKDLIIYTGSLFGWKGVDTIIKAMRYLPEKRLWVAGGNPREIAEKQSLARKWHVQDRCQFKGYISRGDLADPLASAYIGVLPNHREEISERFTSPLKLFEYMAAGKVIVASDLPSIREILDDQKAYLCPPASPRSLAETILSVDRHPEVAQSRIDASRRAAKDYSWDCRATTIGNFLGEIRANAEKKIPAMVA